VSGGRREPDRRWIRQVGVLSGVGLTLVISTVLGLGGGYALDRWLGSSPWFTLAGLLLGIVAGFVNLFRAVGAFDRDDGGRSDREPEP
jgi:ATP synthase protein I